MAGEELVTLDVTQDGAAYLRLNRAEKHNALSPDLIRALIDHLDEIRATPTVRIVLLEGVGKTFSAGGDIDWLRFTADYTHRDNVEDGRLLSDLLHKLHELDQVTVALINGAALGGGCGLIAACDVAVAVKWAEFRFSEVRLGLIPAVISPYVIKAIGPRWSRMLFATGKAFDATLALEMGLIHYMVDDIDALHGRADELVDLVFHAAPGAVRDAKRLVEDVMWRELAGVRHMTIERFADRRASEEGKEGLSAFLEKRKPRWAE